MLLRSGTSPTRRCIVVGGLVALMAGAFLAVSPEQIAGASGIADVVTNCSGSAGTTGSLPFWVALAGAGDPTITFSVTCSPTSPIVLSSTIDITQNLTIDNQSGPSTVAVSGGNTVGAFDVSSGITATITGLTIENGSATSGGAVSNSGTLTVADSTIADNMAQSAGVGGGALYNVGSLTVTNTVISGNSAQTGGGVGTSEGGGIYNDGSLTVTDGTISGNTAFTGGGIYNDIQSTATILKSTLSGNSGDNFGGGVFNLGTLTGSASTFSGNSSIYGGGIDNDYTVIGETTYSGILTVTNCTIAGNTAQEGGGLLNRGTETVIASTISGNTSTSFAGGGIDNGGTATIGATIVAGNTGKGSEQNCLLLGPPLTDAGYNLTDDAAGMACGFTASTDVVGMAPNLGALGANGGPTQTMLPAPNSPAAGKIPLGTTLDAVSACPGTDQRGVARPIPPGSRCTIGAVEIRMPPTITEVVFTGSAKHPMVTITGTGFATVPPSVVAGCGATGKDYANNDLYLQDLTTVWNAGMPGDCVGLKVTRYSKSKIKFDFGNWYRAHTPTLAAGNSFQVGVDGVAVNGTISYS